MRSPHCEKCFESFDSPATAGKNLKEKDGRSLCINCRGETSAVVVPEPHVSHKIRFGSEKKNRKYLCKNTLLSKGKRRPKFFDDFEPGDIIQIGSGVRGDLNYAIESVKRFGVVLEIAGEDTLRLISKTR